MRKFVRSMVALALVTTAAGTLQAGEHSFGLRVGSFQFADSDVLTQGPYEVFPPEVGGPDNFEKFVTSVDFDGSDLDRVFWEFYYEYRRDTDSHFAFSFQAGLGSADSSNSVPGVVTAPRDPWDYDRDGNLGLPTGTPERVRASVDTILEHTIYFVQFVPKYYFTTGKARFYLGAGLGLWANIWHQKMTATWVDVLSCNPPPAAVSCPGTETFGLSDGNRRTVVPFSFNAGFTWQFRPHWTFYVEDQYLFNGDSNVSLYRIDSSFTISGNQIFVGFAYQM